MNYQAGNAFVWFQVLWLWRDYCINALSTLSQKIHYKLTTPSKPLHLKV